MEKELSKLNNNFMQLFPKQFFTKDAVTVAKSILGSVIEYNGRSGMIVETEAYMSDPASHAYKRTPRSELMFTTYAYWYIYFVYGMYFCINVTTNGLSEPGAVLIRAIEPLTGIDKMKLARKYQQSKDNYNLCSGPGKVCTALSIDKSLNGTDIHDKIKLFKFKQFNDNEISCSKRVGITNGAELEWRFYIKDNKFVSQAKINPNNVKQVTIEK